MCVLLEMFARALFVHSDDWQFQDDGRTSTNIVPPVLDIRDVLYASLVDSESFIARARGCVRARVCGMDGGWGVGGPGGSGFVPPPLFARAPPAPASHDSLFALPHHPSIPRVASFDLFPGAEGTARGGGGGGGAGAGGGARVRGDASSSAYPPAPRRFGAPGVPPPPASPHHPHHVRAARADAPTAGPLWHALSPGTDLNKPPATSRVSSDAASVEPWQPYRLFPTHTPPPGGPAPPDFVSTADNLKTLLQLPWTNRPVRLAVHRLGNTLLLDDVVVDPTSESHDPFRAPRADTNGGELPPRSRRAPPGFPASPRGSTPVSIPPLPPRAPPRDYAAAAAAASDADADADAPPPPPRVITGEAHAMLEAKLLYHSLSAETRFDLPRLDDAAYSRRERSRDASNASARLALPAPVPTPDGGAMVLWGAEDVHEDADADANANAGRWTTDRGVVSERLSPPASVAPLGALQLRGPAKAVARAAAAAAAGAGVTLARNPYETPAADEERGEEDAEEEDAEEDSGPRAGSDVDSGSGARSVRAGGGRSRRGRSTANAPRDGDWSSSSSSSSGPRVPPDFGQPRLFEWEVGGHRLLVESSLVVFRGEGRTPMSLKLVDLAAERPNTGAALSTWLDNTIAGVPELAVCYHRDGLIHHYDVLRTDDVARLCAPPFDPDAILAYAERVLAFLRLHCSDDGSQYWLLGDGTPEGGLHLYDVTKGVAAGTGDASDRDDESGGAASNDDGSETRANATPALPAPAPIRLPWIDHSSSAAASASVRSGSVSGATTPSDAGAGAGSSFGVPGVAGAAGRYALLERVAAVLSADAHPEMFAAYKEELAAACLSGADVDPDSAEDVVAASRKRDPDSADGFDVVDDEGGGARAPSTTPGAAPPLASSRGDLAPGVGPRAARRALEHLTEAERALAGAAAKARREAGDSGNTRPSRPNDDPDEMVRADRKTDESERRREGSSPARPPGPGSAPLSAPFLDPASAPSSAPAPAPSSAGKLEAQLRRVRDARCACKVGMARRAYRAGRLGTALALAESAVADAPDSAAALAATADAHAALRDAAGSPGAVAAAAREWRVARRAERRREGTNRGGKDEDEGDEGDAIVVRGTGKTSGEADANGAHPDANEAHPDANPFGAAPPFFFAGSGPGDAARHAAAAESCYYAAATSATAASDPAGLSNVWRRYGAIRNERGKAELQAAAAALEGPATTSGRGGKIDGGGRSKENARGALVRAEECYADAAAAFEAARDPVNAALVGLNRAQARRARSAWNLPPTTPPTNDPPGDDLRWRLEEFDAAARLCRGALASLSRRGGGGARAVSVPPGVVAAVRVELANALLAEGLLRSERADPGAPESAASGLAVARMEEAIRTLQVGVAGSPAAAATLATAHYHLGVILADAALAEDDGASGGAGSAAGAGRGANAGQGAGGISPLAAPQRHLERALAGFPAEAAPLDHARLRVRLARLAAAAARAAALAGAGAAAGVGHLEASLSHLLAAAPAFERRPTNPGGAKAKADAAWSEARRDTVVALLDALEALVRSSKGGKRHAAHRELFSAALRSLGGERGATENVEDIDGIDGAGEESDEGGAAAGGNADASWVAFAGKLRELEAAARASHVVR